MIPGFNEQTQPLNDYELTKLTPQLIKGLKKAIGVDNAITAIEIETRMKEYSFKINGARIRKIVNYIRINNIIPFLMASSKGYYIETNVTKLQLYIKSLENRAEAIQVVANTLKKQIELAHKQTNIFNDEN
tara:strand:+ start:99 stop:491 length:393 start_codon:yes stop_codon:yes gene_type:complete